MRYGIPDPQVFSGLKVRNGGNRFTGCGTAGNRQRGRQCDDPGKHFLFLHDSFPPFDEDDLRSAFREHTPRTGKVKSGMESFLICDG